VRVFLSAAVLVLLGSIAVADIAGPIGSSGFVSSGPRPGVIGALGGLGGGSSPTGANCLLISGTTTNCLLISGTTTNALLVK
jgi:hypothetical protein